MRKGHIVTTVCILSVLLIAILLLSKKSITIGVVLPTSTQLGYEEDLVFRFYRDRFKERGIPIDVIIENPPLDSAAIVESFQRLTTNGADIIIGGEISKSGVILANESAKSGIMTLGITTSTHLLNGIKDNFYRINPSTDAVGTPFGAYVSAKGTKRVAVITSASNVAYAQALRTSFEEGFNGESMNLDYSDKPSLIDSILTFNPDAVVIILPGIELGRCIQRIRVHYPAMPVYASDWGFSQLTTIFAGEELNNIYTFTRRIEPDPSFKPLIKEFEKQYQIECSFPGTYALSIGKLIEEMAEQTNYNIEEMKQTIEKPATYSTGFGQIYMNEFGDAFNEFLYIRSFENGILKTIEAIPQKEFHGK